MASNFSFPKGFLWGAATSAHQVEGANRNDWTEWEQANALRLAREASAKFSHLKNWAEIRAEAENPANYISGRACDHYQRFREDFDIAKQLGSTAHRFSIEWSRVEPEEGKFDERAIEHYREVVRALRERGMEPFVTLWHWTLPLWVRDQGGWEERETVDRFLRYLDVVVAALGSEVRFWLPLNEPTVFAGHSYVIGTFPPGVRSLRRANRVLRNLREAARRSYSPIHRLVPDARVGVVHYLIFHEPYGGYLRNRLITPLIDWIRNWRFIGSSADACDFLGIDYYHHDAIHLRWGRGRWGPVDIRNRNEWVNDLGWEVYPRGLEKLLRRAGRYGKPIYIMENGTADGRDAHRARFIREHLAAIARATEAGVDVRGYFHWSLLDNFEWDKGFWPRFGLVEVNRRTLERKIRPSAWEYKAIIENGIPLQ